MGQRAREILNVEFTKALQDLFDSVGSRLKGIRLRQGKTQRNVQGDTGISDVYISGLEHGKRNPTLEKLCLLAHAYGYSIVVLIETDKDIELVTESVEELRRHERDEGKYIQVLTSIRDEINDVLGQKEEE